MGGVFQKSLLYLGAASRSSNGVYLHCYKSIPSKVRSTQLPQRRHRGREVYPRATRVAWRGAKQIALPIQNLRGRERFRNSSPSPLAKKKNLDSQIFQKLCVFFLAIKGEASHFRSCATHWRQHFCRLIPNAMHHEAGSKRVALRAIDFYGGLITLFKRGQI